MRKTEILPWTGEWVKLFDEEATILKKVFINIILDIYHIGSTSIQTIGFAKPIIDILIVVDDIEKVDLYNDKMISLGYNPRGENGIAGRRYFTKGNDKRTHHIHIYQKGHKNIKIHLDFKEYLIKHPEEAGSYGELKVKLAELFPLDSHKYQVGKEEFVSRLVEKAIRWSKKG